MKKELFDDLVASIKQAGQMHRGEAEAWRTTRAKHDDDNKHAGGVPEISRWQAPKARHHRM